MKTNDRDNKSSNGLGKIIRSSIQKHGSPLLLISRQTLRERYRLFKKYLPRVEAFYAIKANPHPEIIKTFKNLGTGFDVASGAEMKDVLKIGASPSKLIFAHTIKSEEDIALARRRRVNMMTYDNESEIYKIAKHYPGARVLLRIKVSNVGSVVPLSLKFGADSDQAIFLLQKAKTLGLKPVGISFHVGSQCNNVDNFVHALEISSAIFHQAKDNGLKLSVLDIGGGFPIKQFDKEKEPPLKELAGVIHNKLSRLFDKSVRIIAEPGRFLVGPAGTLVTQVIGRSFRDNKNFYYLNDGIYGDFSGIIFDHCQYEFKTLRRGQKFLSTLAGPTCDSFDTISLSEDLPELDVGNVVYVKNIGAYSSATAVPNFNGFKSAKIVFV